MKIECQNCGAGMKFIPNTQKCLCEHCGTEIDVSKINISEFENVEGLEKNTVYDECTCSSCGARLITNENTTVTNCVYCGGNQIIKERFQGEFRPDSIIPFKIDKETFMSGYNKFIKKKILAPKSFKNNIRINDIKGMYVPFYIYDFQASTYARGVAVKRIENKVYTDYFEAKYDLNMTFCQDISSNFKNNTMNSLKPYDFKELQNFNPGYLTGFTAEKGDEDLDAIEKEARRNVIKNEINFFDEEIISSYNFNGGKNTQK